MKPLLIIDIQNDYFPAGAMALSLGCVSVPAREVHAAFMAGLQGIYAKVVSANELAAEMGA